MIINNFISNQNPINIIRQFERSREPNLVKNFKVNTSRYDFSFHYEKSTRRDGSEFF